MNAAFRLDANLLIFLGELPKDSRKMRSPQHE
jgi:hypothetical protein